MERKDGFLMKRNHLFVVLVIGLALFGVLSQLVTNFTGFVKQLLYISLIISFVFMISYLLVKFLSNQPSEMKKYRQAAKQSNKKYNQLKKIRKQKEKSRIQPFRTHKNRSHFHVIDGKKK